MTFRATFALLASFAFALASCSHGDSDSSKSICGEAC